MRQMPEAPEWLKLLPYDGYGDPLHWQCPKCMANPGEACYVVVDGGRLAHNYGTHPQRRRLALFFAYNPGHPYDETVWAFAVTKREY